MRLIYLLLTCYFCFSCTPTTEREISQNHGEADFYQPEVDLISSETDQEVEVLMPNTNDLGVERIDMRVDGSFERLNDMSVDEPSPLSLRVEGKWYWRKGVLGIDYLLEIVDQVEAADHSITYLAIRYVDEQGHLHELLSNLRTHQNVVHTEEILSAQAIVTGAQRSPTELSIRFKNENGDWSAWVLAQKVESERLSLGSPCRRLDPFQYCDDDSSCVLQADAESPSASCQERFRSEHSTAHAYFNEAEQVFGFELKDVNPHGNRINSIMMNFYDSDGQLIVGDMLEGFIERYTIAAPSGLLSISWSAPWLSYGQDLEPPRSPNRATLFLVNDQGRMSRAIELSFVAPRLVELGAPCDRLSASTLCPNDTVCLDRCAYPEQLSSACPAEIIPHVLDPLLNEYHSDLSTATYYAPALCSAWGQTHVYQFTATESELYSFYTIAESEPLLISVRPYCSYPLHEARCAGRCGLKSLVEYRLEAGETVYLFVNGVYGESAQNYTLGYEVLSEDEIVEFCF